MFVYLICMYIDIFYARGLLLNAWLCKKMTLWHLHKAASGSTTLNTNINHSNRMNNLMLLINLYFNHCCFSRNTHHNVIIFRIFCN